MTSKLEFENDSNDKKYEVKAICNTAIYARVGRSPTRPLFFSLLKRLARRRKHLGANIGYPTPLKASYHLSQTVSAEAISGLFVNKLCSADSKTGS